MAYFRIKKKPKAGESKKQTIQDFKDVTIVFDIDKDNNLLGIELMRK